MKRMFLIVSMFFLCNVVFAQHFDGLIERYGAEKKADVVNISSGMMKVARLFVGGKEKKLFKMIDDMKILSLKNCSEEVKERFLEEIRIAEPQGYETALHSDKKGNKSKVFARKSGEKDVAYKMVVASVENKGDVAIMIMNGKFILSEVAEIFK